MDMRAFTKERGELAHTYAEDGAYRSAARVLRETADTLEAHVAKVEQELDDRVPASFTVSPVKGWNSTPYRQGGRTMDRFERGDGKWRVEENRRTSLMDRPFFVLQLTGSGHWITARGEGFGRYKTAAAAMTAVERKAT